MNWLYWVFNLPRSGFVQQAPRVDRPPPIPSRSCRVLACQSGAASGGTTLFAMTTTFSQTGGVRVGWGTLISFNASWPFASLLVDNSELILACLWKRWVFPRSYIRKLSKCQGIFSVGLRIEHGIESYPEFLVFWTFRFPHLQRELEQRRYDVS
jgi:hypothetical protein